MLRLSGLVLVFLVVVPAGVWCQNYKGTGYGSSGRRKKVYYTGGVPVYKKPYISGGSGSSSSYDRNTDSYTGRGDSYTGNSDPYNRNSDPYSRNGNTYTGIRDSYTGNLDSYNGKKDSYAGNSDSYNRNADSYAGKKDSYTKHGDSYSGYPGSRTKPTGYASLGGGGDRYKPKPMSYKDMFRPSKILQTATASRYLPSLYKPASSSQTLGSGRQFGSTSSKLYGRLNKPFRSPDFEPSSYGSSSGPIYTPAHENDYGASSSTDVYALQSELADARQQLKKKQVEVEALKAKSKLQQKLVDNLTNKKTGNYAADMVYDNVSQLSLLLLDLDRVSKNAGDALSEDLAQVLLTDHSVPHRQISQLRSAVTDFKAKLLKILTHKFTGYDAHEITSSKILKIGDLCETGKVKLDSKYLRREEVVFKTDFGGYAPAVIYGIGAFSVSLDNYQSSNSKSYAYGYRYGYDLINGTPKDLRVKVDAYVSPTSVTFDLGYDDRHHLDYVTITWAACPTGHGGRAKY